MKQLINRNLLILVIALSGLPIRNGSADEYTSIESVPKNEQFLHYIRHQFDESRKKDLLPKTLSDWEEYRQKVHDVLAENVGLIKEEQCELNPQKIAEIKKEGYRIEKLILQTFPEIRATAFAYVPDGEGPFPAVLCVHGHWAGAKQEPAIQSRCIGLARLGFFVLAVDAFGAGERGIGKALGEYHGASVGATLFPSGLLLPGLQIYENSRFVDYLQSRKEVIPDKIGITGASGGGNQTMYAGAMDQRFKAVVPVCSVGTYRSYLGAACCFCELYPGMMPYTEEWALLSMTAPRALMVINATRDAIQFSPQEAKKSIQLSKPVFHFYGKDENLKHVIFESKHDYNQEMREAMYGWMTRHLKGEGNGSPIPEPEHETIDPEQLRCFPGESRPDDFTNLIQFAQAKSRELVNRTNSEWESSSIEEKLPKLKEAFLDQLNSQYAKNGFQSLETVQTSENKLHLSFRPERQVEVEADFYQGEKNRLVILISLNGKLSEKFNATAELLKKKGWNVLVPELRATGSRKIDRDQIRFAVDHNSTEWALWNGIPLLGQWVTDIRCLMDATETIHKKPFDEIVLAGESGGATVAMASAIADDRVTQTVCLNMISSFVPVSAFEHDRIGILVPGILKEAGDVSHLCSLLAPRKLIISGGHLSDGKDLDHSSLEKEFAVTKKVYAQKNSTENLQLVEKAGAEEIASWITE